MGPGEGAGALNRGQRPPLLDLRFDGSLPVHARRSEIAAAIASSAVVIVSGATGSGKSTQLPKICLELGRGRERMIGHTQPRRIAAQALATRLCAELGTTLGDLVGYQVRFVDRSGPRTLVKLMTDGVLLRELARDPWLERYDTLILDEAHERTLNLDFLLGICRRLVTRRPELRVIVTSATIETRRFAEYFDGAPVIEIEGRSYPVELRYRPIAAEDESPLPLSTAVAGAVAELEADSGRIRGDTLVFLPGERQIHETLDLLRRTGPPGLELLPLYSRLSSMEQGRIYAAHTSRRVILATNVAETSLTIPGVRFVVDSGLARVSRYSPRAKLQRLPIEPVSRASADQRQGRCGREGPGICVRLYSEEDYTARPEYTEPEIGRTNLASLVLQMAALGLGAPEEFPFLDPPDQRLLNDAYRLLGELSAVDTERRITQIGRRMARLPVDPRLARILVEAGHLRCLHECLVIVAFLSIQDPRERPADRQDAADERHATFGDPRSDFVTVLRLWEALAVQAAAGPGAMRRWCRDNFLSWLRVREWQDLHEQLGSIARAPRGRGDGTPVPHGVLHRALLSGFLGGIGVRDDERQYLGARDTRFVIAPGTPLARRRPHWVMAASLVDTGRVQARMVAQVQPSWIEAAAAHLVRRNYGEAEWSAERGQVIARETVTLYGRVLHSGRLVDFARVDPDMARRIFVEEAVVRDRGGPAGGFRARNVAAIAAIQDIEARLRRRDLLASEAAIAEFFLERIPAEVTDLRSFRRWWQARQAADPAWLDLPRERLLAQPLPTFAAADYPERLVVAGNELALRYVYDTGAVDDGVTLLLPLPLLPVLRPAQLERLVPGWLREKVIALLRGLPRELRRSLVPIPDAAARFLAQAAPDVPLYEALAAFVTRESGTTLGAEAVAGIALPAWLNMNVQVVDTDGRPLRSGRELASLRRMMGASGSTPALPPQDPWRRDGVRRWDFGSVPATVSIASGGAVLTMYPAIEDRGDSVSLVLCADPGMAESVLRQGEARLAALALAQQHAMVRRMAVEDRELTLRLAAAGLGREIYDELADRAIASCVLVEGEPLPRSEPEFASRLDQGRANVVGAGTAALRIVRETARRLAETRAALAALDSGAALAMRAELEAQLDRLLAPGWLRRTPERWLAQWPKYLQAATRRAQRLRADPTRDARLASQVEPYERALRALESITTPHDVRLDELRWSIEELRLSLHAQELRTRAPVSAKRLDAILAAARRALHGG